MNSELKANLIKYGICVAFALLMVWIYFSLRLDSFEEFSALDIVERFVLLSDAFTIPGGILLMSGALVALSNNGALDGVGYAMRLMVRMLIPGMGRKQERYSDYVERKKDKKLSGYGFLFISGGFFLLIGIVFMVLYNIMA